MIMEYFYSEHYREEPLDEIDAALTANSAVSVKETLEARLLTENKHARLDNEAIDRIQQQLAYVALLTDETKVAA
jgi:hypothetical protein